MGIQKRRMIAGFNAKDVWKSTFQMYNESDFYQETLPTTSLEIINMEIGINIACPQTVIV